jgi:membrane protease YdiL (CAAX protease family)
MTRWLRGHPISGFLLLTFVASYLIGTPILMAYSAWAPAQPPMLRTYFSRTLIVYGPGVASLLMTFIFCGREGILILLKRLMPRASDMPWALLILLVGFGGAAIALKGAGASTSQLEEAIRTAGGLLIGHFALQVLIISIGEELGWRGWLLPRLLERATRLRATIFVGVAWALWHGPLLFSSVSTTVLLLCTSLGVSIIFTWLWSHSGERLFLVVLAHAAVNTPIFFWEDFTKKQGWDTGTAPSAWYILEWMYAFAGCGLVLLNRRWWLQRVQGAKPNSPRPQLDCAV